MTHPQEIRLALMSTAPDTALRLLDVPHISVCGVATHTAQLLHMLPALQPHAVLFFDKAPDLPYILDRITTLLPLTPPRIICRMDEGCAADAVFDRTNAQSLPVLIASACQFPMGVLSQHTFDKRYDIAQKLLSRLGMPELLGRESIALGAVYLSALPQPVPPAQHWLYPLLAEQQHTSASAVERRIRSVIETTWLHGDWHAQGELFGMTVSAERGKPTNAEFLFLLSEHIRLHLT